MDSCVDENGGGKSIAESVGGLVWVRRRNGSWWPGQILKSDELPDGVVVPVRSGTAVRLLGHSDNNLDWYNLEKSKRVKSFRCGEYDVYIENAKATAGINRKAAKYARRSDAIIEALKIENACLGRDPLEFCFRVNELDSRRRRSARDPASMPHDSPADIYKGSNNSDSEDSADSLVDLSRSREKTNNGRCLKLRSVKVKRQRTPDDSEDDLSEGYKRMRGLEDLGMGVVSRNAVVRRGVELVHRSTNSLFDSNAGNLMSNGSPVNSSRSVQSSRRRRSPAAHGHETSKRKDRRRPLTKVLENTAMVAVPVTCDQFVCSNSIPQGLSGGKASELEPNGSKKFSMIKGAKISNIPTLTENDSPDSLYDVPFVVEARDSAGITESNIEVLSRQYSKSCQSGAKSLTNDRVNESGLVRSVDVDSISQRIEEGTSKWQSKGKRNSRQISKDRKTKSDKFMDIDEDDVNLTGLELSDEFSLSLVEKVDGRGIVGSLSTHSSDKVKSTSEYQLDGLQDWGAQISCRDSHMRGLTHMLPPPAEDSPPPQRLLPYRHSRMKVPSKYREPDSPGSKLHSNSLWLDVSVRVDSYYRPQHPLVSLTSNLNGKSIVGHPLTVEVLDDSESVNPGVVESEAIILYGGTNVKSYAVKHLSDARKFSKRISALLKHRSKRKSLKHRKSGLQPKTRKLSSLTGRKLGEEMNLILDQCKGPALAFIPVRVVFSRISEALKGPLRVRRTTHARNTETMNRSQSSAHVNINEAVSRPPRPAQENFIEAVSGPPRSAQSNITKAVNRSPQRAHHAPERIVCPKIIEAVSGSPTPRQCA